MLRISLTVTIVLVLCQSLSAATYYVSKSGSDSNNGTSWAMAWASTGKVNSSLSGGDTVFYGTGTFNGRLLPASGGSSNDRTVYDPNGLDSTFRECLQDCL